MGKIKKEACYTIYYRRLRLLWDQLNMLRGIDPIVRIFNLKALLVHQANETCPRSYATIARSRVT